MPPTPSLTIFEPAGYSYLSREPGGPPRCWLKYVACHNVATGWSPCSRKNRFLPVGLVFGLAPVLLPFAGTKSHTPPLPPSATSESESWTYSAFSRLSFVCHSCH